MKFLITCDNCDGQFLTEGESRQTVQCQCPHCGGQMKVKLPESKTAKTGAPTPNKRGEEDSEEQPRRRTGCGIAIGIFLGLFILVLAGTIYYSMTQHESTQPIEDPFAHAYDDTTNFDDSFEELPVQSFDTIQPEVEEIPVDTIDSISSPIEGMEAVESSEQDVEGEVSGDAAKEDKSMEKTEPAEVQTHTPQTNAAPATKDSKNQ